MAKAAFNMKKNLFTSKLDLILRKKLAKCDASGSRSETPGKSSNVVLEKDGEHQLDRSCEK